MKYQNTVRAKHNVEKKTKREEAKNNGNKYAGRCDFLCGLKKWEQGLLR
jgi:hypothetical protein